MISGQAPWFDLPRLVELTLRLDSAVGSIRENFNRVPGGESVVKMYFEKLSDVQSRAILLLDFYHRFPIKPIVEDYPLILEKMKSVYESVDEPSAFSNLLVRIRDWYCPITLMEEAEMRLADCARNLGTIVLARDLDYNPEEHDT